MKLSIDGMKALARGAKGAVQAPPGEPALAAAAGAAVIPAPAARPPARLRSPEIDFLPAALEIVERPPSPVGRAITATIILFFVIALAWACLSKIDIVATAPGKIIPTGRVKLIQPLEMGVVRAVHVKEGDRVKAGEMLVELDATASSAERDRLSSELVAARLDVARLTAALADGKNQEERFEPPAGASPLQIALQRNLLANLLSEHRAKLAGLDRQRAQHAADRAAIQATIGKLNATIPLLRERATARKTLADKEFGTRSAYLEIQQQLVEQEQERNVQHNRLAESEASLAAIEEERRRVEAEFRRNTLSDLAQAEQKAASLKQELIKAEQRRDLEHLTAPVDGVVQQIQVHTLGGVVTAAQTLMVIVPDDSRLEIEAMVQNKDIGFVHAGQQAEIKIDTFNFTKYGLLHGAVLNVSQDAVQRGGTAASASAGGGASAVATQANGVAPDGTPNTSQELVYPARISLDRTTMRIEDKLVNLGPGMAVTVEIKTGTRRVIEYILSPLARYRDDSLKER